MPPLRSGWHSRMLGIRDCRAIQNNCFGSRPFTIGRYGNLPYAGFTGVGAGSKNVSLAAGKSVDMETGPTKFVGRISLSAESLGKYSTIGRYGYLPYIGMCGRETGPMKFVGDTPAFGTAP